MSGPGAVGSFASISALRSNTFVPTSPYVIALEGYVTTRDGGEGLFSYAPGDTTSADDGGTIIVDGIGQRWYRQFITEMINVRWFGATGNGTTDDTAALQTAVDSAIYRFNVPRVFVPAGIYKTSDVISIGYGYGIGAYPTFTTCYFEGAQYDYAGTTGGTVFMPQFSDRPCIAVQGGRGVVLKNFAIIGAARNYIVSNNLGGSTTTISDFLPTQWIDPAVLSASPNANSQYAPFAGIAIDPYSGAQQSISYPNVTFPPFFPDDVPQYGKAASSKTLLENVFISGFVDGLTIHPNDFVGNGDFTTLSGVSMEANVYCITVGDSQSRTVNIEGNSECSQFHTFVSGSVRGQQIGQFGGIWAGLAVGNCIRLFEVTEAYYGGLSLIGCYGELIWQLGTTGENSSNASPLVFVNCSFNFTDHPTERGIPDKIIDGGAGDIQRPVIFEGGSLAFPAGLLPIFVGAVRVYWNQYSK